MSMIIYLLEDHPTRKPAELTPLIDIFSFIHIIRD